MKLFKKRKKKIYRVVWAFDNQSCYTLTEWVKAYDKVHAWKQITKKHFLAISCREIEEVEFER